MFLDLLRQYSMWVLIALGLLLLISAVAFALAYRRARRAQFFFWRQEAASRCRRLLVLIVLFGAAFGGMLWFVLSSAAPFPASLVQPSPSATPTAASVVEKPPPTPTPASPTPIPSPTPQPAVEATSATAGTERTPTPTSAPTGPEGRFHDIVLARGVSSANEPVGPTTEFVSPTERVFVFFTYANMVDGSSWTQVWLRGTIELAREVDSWKWGGFGRAYVFFGPAGGYEAGEYRVQLFTGDRLQGEATFTVR